MTQAQIAKDDTVLEKYTIDAVTSFIKTILADLGKTYKRSNITQLKVLLGSIFPTGMAWSYNGTLNHTISPIYQSIRTFREDAAPSGVDDGIRTRDVQLHKLALYH